MNKTGGCPRCSGTGQFVTGNPAALVVCPECTGRGIPVRRDMYANLETLTITDEVGTVIMRFGMLYDLERWLYRRGMILVPIEKPH